MPRFSKENGPPTKEDALGVSIKPVVEGRQLNNTFKDEENVYTGNSNFTSC